MHHPSDFRSDTVTKPTEAMRKAMAKAEVGDDVLGDDPTVRALEERAAEILGKEAALYVPSGTMGNALAIKIWTREGDEVLTEERAHILNYESGHPAVFSRVMVRPLPSNRGEIPFSVLEHAMNKRKNIHVPQPVLLTLENTHNFWSGRVLSPSYMEQVYRLAHAYGLHVHLDGARIWNAAVALDVEERVFTQFTDTVMACFSKGLGAPVGSIVAGPMEKIEEARRYRKMLGGGMRQAGIIAAGALYALEHHRERLIEDHHRARRIAEELAQYPQMKVDLEAIQTNIVFVDLQPPYIATDLVQFLKDRDVLILSTGERTIRIVTHLDVDDEDVDRLLMGVKAFFKENTM